MWLCALCFRLVLFLQIAVGAAAGVNLIRCFNLNISGFLWEIPEKLQAHSEGKLVFGVEECPEEADGSPDIPIRKKIIFAGNNIGNALFFQAGFEHFGLPVRTVEHGNI